MAFAIKTQKGLAKNLRRMARSQVQKAVDGLESADRSDLEEAVHQARKRFKKVRALVRLGRKGLGKKRTKRENKRFRDAGRLLSEVRDADVLITTLEGLTKRSEDAGHDEIVGRLREALVARKEEARCRVFEKGKNVEQVLDMMRDARGDIKGWKLKRKGWKALKSGLKTIYKQGYHALGDAQDDPEDETLHDWRKRVKELWHAFQILKPIRPHELGAHAEQAERLADLLGEDHDLAVLRDTVRELDDVRCGCVSVEAIMPLIDDRRQELQRQAMALGPSVFAEKPREFLDRMQESWKNREVEPSRETSAGE